MPEDHAEETPEENPVTEQTPAPELVASASEHVDEAGNQILSLLQQIAERDPSSDTADLKSSLSGITDQISSLSARIDEVAARLPRPEVSSPAPELPAVEPIKPKFQLGKRKQRA